MSYIKRVLFFLVLGVLTLGASIFMIDRTLKGKDGVGGLAQSIEAYKLRAANPTMSGQKIEKLAAKKAEDYGSSPLAVVEALNSVQKQQAANTAATNATAVSGNGQTAAVAQEQPVTVVKETVAVVHAPQAVDPSAYDKIMSLHVSDEIRKKILDNYNRTGILPEIVTHEIRVPAATTESDPAAL